MLWMKDILPQDISAWLFLISVTWNVTPKRFQHLVLCITCRHLQVTSATWCYFLYFMSIIVSTVIMTNFSLGMIMFTEVSKVSLLEHLRDCIALYFLYIKWR